MAGAHSGRAHLPYSLYLWQQIFLAPEGIALPVVGTTPLAVPAAFAAAPLSYLLVERPFLGLKDRLGRTWAIPPTARPVAGADWDGRRDATSNVGDSTSGRR